MYSKGIVCSLMLYPQKFKIMMLYKLFKLKSKGFQIQEPIFGSRKGHTCKQTITTHINTCFQVRPRGNFWFSVSKPNISIIKQKCYIFAAKTSFQRKKYKTKKICHISIIIRTNFRKNRSEKNKICYVPGLRKSV